MQWQTKKGDVHEFVTHVICYQQLQKVSLAYGRAYLRQSRLQSLLYGVGGGFRDARYDARKEERYNHMHQHAFGGSRRSLSGGERDRGYGRHAR